MCVFVCLGVRVFVCVMYCRLSVDSTDLNTWKREKKSSSQLCSITDRKTQNSNQACSSALHYGWILMFLVWISVRALKSALLLYSGLFFSSLAFFLFLHSPFFSFSSLLSTHSSSAHTAKREFCVSWQSHYPSIRPLFPLYLPCGLVREICTTSSFTPAAEVVHWIIYCTNRCHKTAFYHPFDCCDTLLMSQCHDCVCHRMPLWCIDVWHTLPRGIIFILNSNHDMEYNHGHSSKQ